MGIERRLAVVLVWLATAPLCNGQQTQVSRRAIAQLLEELVSGAPAAKRSAEARLTTLGRQSRGLLGEELLRLRQKELFVSRLLKEDPDRRGVSLFFSGKFREAERAFGDGRYAKARALCESMLILGVPETSRVSVRRLLKLARDREFAGGTVQANLRALRRIVGPGEKPELVLGIHNRAEFPIDVDLTVGGQLHVSYTTIDESGQLYEEKVTERLTLPAARFSVAPGDSWETRIELTTDNASVISCALQRIRLRGQLIRVGITGGGRSWHRTLQIPLVEVFRAAENLADAVREPLEAITEGISSGDTNRLLVGSVVAVWEGELDSAVALLLKGTAGSREVSEASFFLLKLLTGEHLGRDRRRWILYYLSRERLPTNGPLSG